MKILSVSLALVMWIVFTISYVHMEDIEGDVRLVDGIDQYEGRIEIFAEGRWGTVCTRGFEVMAGQVVCRQLGYFNQDDDGTTSMPVAILANAYFGENTEIPVNLADLRCNGLEANLTLCEGAKWGDDVVDCDHSQDVGLVCGNGNDTSGDIRLIGGGVGVESEGQIYYLNSGLQWGTVCDFSWDLEDADVACRQLGYNYSFATLAARNSLYGGYNSGQEISMAQIECGGNEDFLDECPHEAVPSIPEECRNHQHDAGVKCADEPLDGTLRLIRGTMPNQGTLQIFHGGEWGTICLDDSWTDVEALVACRHLGYDTVRGFITSGELSTGAILLDAVSCYGYELTLANCAHGNWGDVSPSCTQGTNVMLICDNVRVEEGDVRLVGGFLRSEGRIEYYDNHADDEWETICDRVGDLKDATVVCRQLGYLTASHAFGNSYFGEGATDQNVRTVSCHGYEAGLGDCRTLFGPVECQDHQRDAGIICTDQVNEGEIRLVNGSDYTEGRLEIYHDSQWGTICSNNWYGDDAFVACHQMGLGQVEDALNDYGPGQGPILLDDVECVGDEMNITSCVHGGWGGHDDDCGHESNVGIACFLLKDPVDGEVRLTGGPDYTKGRVEIYIEQENAWYSVCHDEGWTEQDAEVVCHQLGLELDSEFEDFGAALQPVRINNVNCIGTESLLNFCDYDLQDTECGADDAVGIACQEVSLREGEIRLKDGETYDQGRLEINHEGIWGYICKESWSMTEAEVACHQLGYEYTHDSDVVITNAYDRPFHLENVECDGDEEQLIDCEHDPWGEADCDQDDSVAIACSNTPVDESLEGWAIALIVIFSVAIVGVGGSAFGYCIYKKKKNSYV